VIPHLLGAAGALALEHERGVVLIAHEHPSIKQSKMKIRSLLQSPSTTMW
jgi:hypothetical protein